MTYKVTAKAWEQGWELHVEGVGVTQSEGAARPWQEAEEMAREAVALALDVPIGEVMIRAVWREPFFSRTSKAIRRESREEAP